MAPVHLFFGLICSLAHGATKDGAVVIVVDPVWDDTAGYYANVPLLQQYEIVKVKTRQGKSQSYVSGHVDLYRDFHYSGLKPNPDAAAEEICPRLKSMPIPAVAVVPTSDATVHLADLLNACLGLRGNPSTGPLAEARRDKWVMGEAVRKAGLRSVKQKLVSSWNEAEQFLESWSPPLSPQKPCVYKILSGSAGEGVVEVTSMKQAKEVFDSLHSTTGKFGETNTVVLIQEYLQGREFAVDSVSRDGVHKVVAVWFEDFRPANGIFDQYFGFKMLDPENPRVKAIVAYSNKVLDALGLYNGAANTEIKWLEDEDQPCLVEVNARWAGISWNDGLAVETATVGLDQVTAAFTAYLDEDGFAQMPAVRPLLQHGALVFTLAFQAGVLTGIPGLDAARKSPSYLTDAVDVTIGKPIAKTTPARIPVSIGLANRDKAVVDSDYYRMIDLEQANAFFAIAPAGGFLSAIAAVNSPTSRYTDALGLLGMLAGMCLVFLGAAHKHSSGQNVDDVAYIAVE